jgi:cGMP-dependent protein kinase
VLDENDVKLVCQRLKEHSLFCTLEDKELREVAASMKLATALNNTYIFQEGDNGDCFFLIKRGEVDVEIEHKCIRTMGAGECFGELALIFCTKRTAGIKCRSSELELFVIKGKEFKKVMRDIRDKNNEKTKSLI